MQTLTPDEISARYQLLCRASHLDPDDSPIQNELAAELAKLKALLTHELPELARQRSPHAFAEIHQNLLLEMERFHEFCEFPDLAAKTVVGLGGAFSAGKSSLVNALLGHKRLATEVDPTTSLPTYLLQGKEDSVTALNLFKRRVTLSQEEFLSLTHDEKEYYGSQVSALLHSAFISLEKFPFDNLALLDTPGYSKPEDTNGPDDRTDANLARAQLNSAQFIIWVVSAEKGTIPEDDLEFLGSLRQDIPRLVVVSRADKRTPEDMEKMVSLIRSTLDNRALSAVDVLPFSSRKKKDYPVAPILHWLGAWNLQPRDPGFAVNFKRQFSVYQSFIESEQRQTNRRLNRLNRILAITDDNDVLSDAGELRDIAKTTLEQLDQIGEELFGLRQSFFRGLKTLGDHLGIPLPEPGDIDLIELNQLDLLSLLREERELQEIPEADWCSVFSELARPHEAMNIPGLVRSRCIDTPKAIGVLNIEKAPENKARLLNQNTISHSRFVCELL